MFRICLHATSIRISAQVGKFPDPNYQAHDFQAQTDMNIIKHKHQQEIRIQKRIRYNNPTDMNIAFLFGIQYASTRFSSKNQHNK
jgi:hypothetical protein